LDSAIEDEDTTLSGVLTGICFMREMPVLWRQDHQPFALFATAQRRNEQRL
jgi:hypothetical protein